jgi:lysophospholipase L1-like esterase
MPRKPLRLTDQQMNDICDMLATGSSRSTAAQFAGCHPATMRAEMRRNPTFAHRVAQAELKLEAQLLRTIRHAASDPKQWRAAAWALERIYPNRYAKRRSNTLTVDQVHEVISEVSEIVAAELPVPKFRQPIFDRLAVLVTTVQVRAPMKPGTDNVHVIQPHSEQPRRLEGPAPCNASGDRSGESETPPPASSEPTGSPD